MSMVGHRVHPRRGRRLLAPCLILLAAVAAVAAAEWVVDDDGPADFAAIQPAVYAPFVLPGDTIRVRPGVYRETLYLASKDLVIVSEAGPFATIIDAQEGGSVVSLLDRTVATRIEGFTLRNGRDQTGGGVFIYRGGPILRRNIIMGNNAAGGYLGYGYGGGIEIVESAPVVVNNVIYGNTALDGGGGIDVYYSGPSTPGTCCPFISRNTIVDNRVTSPAGLGGGILVSGAEPAIDSCVVSGNLASGGGGLYVERLQGISDMPEVTTNIFFANVPDRAASNGSLHLPSSNRDTDPRLGPGTWMSFWPRSDSPAIDAAGPGAPPAADLTGLATAVDGDLDGDPAGDIGAVENRGEITGLMVSPLTGGPGAILTWDDSVNSAVTFTLRASDNDPFRTGPGMCLATGLTDLTFTDLTPLPPGAVRFYLVTGSGAGAGSAGLRSDGSARPVGGCGG